MASTLWNSHKAYMQGILIQLGAKAKETVQSNPIETIAGHSPVRNQKRLVLTQKSPHPCLNSKRSDG